MNTISLLLHAEANSLNTTSVRHLASFSVSVRLLAPYRNICIFTNLYHLLSRAYFNSKIRLIRAESIRIRMHFEGPAQSEVFKRSPIYIISLRVTFDTSSPWRVFLLCGLLTEMQSTSFLESDRNGNSIEIDNVTLNKSKNVYKCKLNDGKEAAVKKIVAVDSTTVELKHHLKCKDFLKLKHDNVVSYHNCIIEGSVRYYIASVNYNVKRLLNEFY